MEGLIYGHRTRIGYTCSPVIAEVFPYEFYKVVPEGVTLAIPTLTVLKAIGDELQTSYDISLRTSREMGAAGVDLMVLWGAPDLSSEYLGRAECEVIASAPMPSAPPLNYLGRLSSEASFEVACELVRAHLEADTRYFPCAHRATIDKLESMEEELGVGVLSASSALSGRRCGIREPIQGFGRLFRDPGDG